MHYFGPFETFVDIDEAIKEFFRSKTSFAKEFAAYIYQTWQEKRKDPKAAYLELQNLLIAQLIENKRISMEAAQQISAEGYRIWLATKQDPRAAVNTLLLFAKREWEQAPQQDFALTILQNAQRQKDGLQQKYDSSKEKFLKYVPLSFTILFATGALIYAVMPAIASGAALLFNAAEIAADVAFTSSLYLSVAATATYGGYISRVRYKLTQADKSLALLKDLDARSEYSSDNSTSPKAGSETDLVNVPSNDNLPSADNAAPLTEKSPDLDIRTTPPSIVNVTNSSSDGSDVQTTAAATNPDEQLERTRTRSTSQPST